MTEYALYELESGCCLYAPDVIKRNNETYLNQFNHSTYTEEDILYIEGCLESGHLDPWPQVCTEHKDWVGSVITKMVDLVEIAVVTESLLPRLLVVPVSGENDDTTLCFGHSKTDMLVLYGDGMLHVIACAIQKLDGGDEYATISPEYIKQAEEMVNE